MRAPERIVTERLVLRRPRDADAEAIFARYSGDAEVTRLLSWPTHTAVETTRAFIAMSDAQWRDNPAGPMLVTARSAGTILGSTGLTFHPSGVVETGYLIARDSWGKGYASEALRGMLDLACAIGIRSVQAHCHTSNAASMHVLEKCGFVGRRLAPAFLVFPNLPTAEPSDVYVYTVDLQPGRRPRIHLLRSERLGFGIWGPADLPLAGALWGDARVTALIDSQGPLTDGRLRERLAREISCQEEERISYWPLFMLATGEFAGCCGLRPYRPESKIYELGVHLRPEYWGQGLATEACHEVIRYAFREMGATGLFAGHHPDNASSRSLLLRLGFHHTHDELYPPTGLRHPSYLLSADAPQG